MYLTVHALGRTFQVSQLCPCPGGPPSKVPRDIPLQPVSWDVRAPEYPVQHLDEGPHFFVGVDGNTQMIVYQRGFFEIPNEYARVSTSALSTGPRPVMPWLANTKLVDESGTLKSRFNSAVNHSPVTDFPGDAPVNCLSSSAAMLSVIASPCPAAVRNWNEFLRASTPVSACCHQRQGLSSSR